MSDDSLDSGAEVQKLLLFCVPFSDKKILQRILDTLMKDFGVTGGSIIDCSSSYTFNGASFPAQTQHRLEFTIPSDGSNQKIVSFIQDAIKKAGWETPFIQSTNVSLNPDAFSYVEAGHSEASRLRRLQSRLKVGLTALSLLLAPVVGALIHQHSVNEQNQAVLKRVSDLQAKVENQVLAIEAKLAEGGSLARQEPSEFGVPSYSETHDVLDTVREIQLELEQALGDR